MRKALLLTVFFAFALLVGAQQKSTHGIYIRSAIGVFSYDIHRIYTIGWEKISNKNISFTPRVGLTFLYDSGGDETSSWDTYMLGIETGMNLRLTRPNWPAAGIDYSLIALSEVQKYHEIEVAFSMAPYVSTGNLFKDFELRFCLGLMASVYQEEIGGLAGVTFSYRFIKKQKTPSLY